MFKVILEYSGALVSVTESAEQALRLLDRVIPDVLVSDIAMPARDGFWWIGRVRERRPEQGGAVPAVAVTAGLCPQDILAAGFQVCLQQTH
jgi:CheY-like chemotaxis protein